MAGVVLIFVMMNYTVAVICGFCPWNLLNLFNRYSPPPVAFAGNSIDCQATALVATLESPRLLGKNVIWCGTFQLAYDELKTAFGPFKAAEAQGVVRQLDQGRMKPGDLPEGGYYAMAGKIGGAGDIVEKIKSEMKRKFPQAKPHLPKFDEGDWLGYAYLAANVKFQTPYFDEEFGEEFTDSAGKKTRVSSFGFMMSEVDVNDILAEQIRVLYAGDDKYQTTEFALELDKNTQPSQLILACVVPKETLAATWQDLQRKMEQWKPVHGEDKFTLHSDLLSVPNLNFKIEHSFKDLEPELARMMGRAYCRTLQTIDFRLDKSGAELASDSGLCAGAAASRDFRFNRPFLIVMRKRGAAEPYFVMWVDNAELLCKYGGK